MEERCRTEKEKAIVNDKGIEVTDLYNGRQMDIVESGME